MERDQKKQLTRSEMLLVSVRISQLIQLLEEERASAESLAERQELLATLEGYERMLKESRKLAKPYLPKGVSTLTVVK